MTAPEKPKPVLPVRPQFDIGLVMVESVLAGIAGAAVGFFGLGIFLYLFVIILGLGNLFSAGFVFGTCFVVGLVGMPPLFFELKKTAYRRTIFHFYDSYFEFQDFKFFLTRRRQRVRYSDITDVYERATSLQHRRVLTSVYIEVPKMASGPRGGFAGVKIPDVHESGDLRSKVVALIEAASQKIIP